MKIIIAVLFIAAVWVAYIQGEDAGYKKGKKEVLNEMQNLHKNVNAYSVMREASFNAASKRLPRKRR